MSLFPVPNPTWSDLLGAQMMTFAQDPMFRAAAKSWAYYTLQAFDPRFGATFDSPYVEWDTEIDGPRPRCQPTGRIIIDGGAEFLMGETPRFTITETDSADLEALVNSILDQNAIDAKLLPLARQSANEGGCWLKFAWTPDVAERPVAISFLSPWEVKAQRDPLDADRLLSARIRIKFQDDADGKWYLYQEVWTPEKYTTYKRLLTSEHDDTQALAGFVAGEWPIDKVQTNRFRMIPLTQVYNRRLGCETDGVGDLWDIYGLIADYSHTFWLMNRSNQWDGDPITALINVTSGPKQLIPGDLVHLKGQDADIKRLIPENNLREWMQKYAVDVERNALDAVGADRLNPSEVTNKGNLTRQVMELIFHRSVKSCLEKRKNWGKFGVAVFLQRMLLALSRLDDARARFPALKSVDVLTPESYAVVIRWPPMFKITFEERQGMLADLISSVEADLLSWERAVELAAELFGIDDVQALKDELKTQKAEKKALTDEQQQTELSAKSKPQPTGE